MSRSITSGVRAGRIVVMCAAAIMGVAILSGRSFAQDADHDHHLDHEHDYLHFSHPLVTESPSPDTKLRFDAVFLTVDAAGADAAEARAEYEHAFARTFSIALVVPFDRISAPRGSRAKGLGNVELSAKAASFAFAQSGVLTGGGLTVGFPTGSDVKGIGSDHLYEISPFVDAGVRRGPVELVGFLTYSMLAHRTAGDENERELTFDGSVLWRAAEEIELLAEVSNTHSYGASEGAYTETFIAPGIKWRPARYEKFAAGVSAIRGVANARGSNAVQLSAFYHF